MDLVKTIEQLQKNAVTLDNYLGSNDDDEKTYAKQRVRQGRCFVWKKTSSGYKFYPSKFVGYINNTMEEHKIKYSQRDGRDTNKNIEKILGTYNEDSELEKRYREYCSQLGIESYKRNHKFWEKEI